MKNNNVIAVVVTYQPDLATLIKQINYLSLQVERIVVVDNGSSEAVANAVKNINGCTVLSLYENYGLPYAQNVGIKFALSDTCKYVLLMDQDSIPDPSMVDCLLDGFSDKDVVAVGSSYFDARNHVYSFFVIETLGKPRKIKVNEQHNAAKYIEVAALISSGTLIKVSAFTNVGFLRSDYFIDRVDTEWSLRARAKGYKLIGATTPLMTHTIGDEIKRVWFFGWRNVPYHSPIRDYYLFRNTFHILRDLKLSFAWKIHFIKILFLFLGYFLLFSNDRFKRMYFMLLGVMHGMLNIRGKLT